ncbi:MAG: hypothetical protein CL730_00065 [Chloroflexi bacterium]|jgi:hypothetical protein|nr:hypothetical protein [Chloroflexota bacterium]|tara:strand:+ start:8942 stop:9247 length:306 start_codon:yes stop_codon:yes gene_type:complete
MENGETLFKEFLADMKSYLIHEFGKKQGTQDFENVTTKDWLEYRKENLEKDIEQYYEDGFFDWTDIEDNERRKTELAFINKILTINKNMQKIYLADLESER